MIGGKRDLYLILLYHATWLTGERKIRVKDIFKNYECGITPHEFLQYIGHKNNHDLINISKSDVGDWERKIELTFKGEAYVEENFGENAAAILEQHGIRHILSERTQDEDAASVESSLWTGIPSATAIGEEKKARLIEALRSVDGSLESLPLSNAERSQARAYVIAAICLADTPDPPADLIWEMLQRAAAIAGIASLFVSVFALLKA